MTSVEVLSVSIAVLATLMTALRASWIFGRAKSEGESGGRPGRRIVMWSIGRTLAAAFAVAGIAFFLAWVFIYWLLGSPSRKTFEPLSLASQLDLLKLVFALVAGMGALVALVISYRRQRVAEIEAEYNAQSAKQRQATELYGQAVEQLGHREAAVRLGGMYSLERLAQDYPEHRQTVMSIICAYLRMPLAATDRQQDPEQRSADSGGGPIRPEMQVRLTAQRILQRHLHYPNGRHSDGSNTFWSDISIDLADAYLVNFDLDRCRILQGNFSGATFDGEANFSGAEFIGAANFRGAYFADNVFFDGGHFSDDTDFMNSVFDGSAGFDRVTFSKATQFEAARFTQNISFEGASFDGDVTFRGVRFDAGVSFRGVHFGGVARFISVRFSQEPNLSGAMATVSSGHEWPEDWQISSAIDSENVAPLERRK